jgi:hypothetical protein
MVTVPPVCPIDVVPLDAGYAIPQRLSFSECGDALLQRVQTITYSPFVE